MTFEDKIEYLLDNVGGSSGPKIPFSLTDWNGYADDMREYCNKNNISYVYVGVREFHVKHNEILTHYIKSKKLKEILNG